MDYADISLGSYYGKAGELKLILSSIKERMAVALWYM